LPSSGKQTYKNPRKNTLWAHKPGCKCRPCQGKAKARLIAAGAAGEALAANPPSESELPKETRRRPWDIKKSEYSDYPVPVIPDHSKRATVLRIIELRGSGFTTAEVSEALGIKPATISEYMRKAVREGWIILDDPRERFEHKIVPKVVDNIEHFIDLKDRTMTIEAAKGSGIFQSHQAVKVDGTAPQAVLALNINPIAGNEPTVIRGRVVGRPKEISE